MTFSSEHAPAQLPSVPAGCWQRDSLRHPDCCINLLALGCHSFVHVCQDPSDLLLTLKIQGKDVKAWSFICVLQGLVSVLRAFLVRLLMGVQSSQERSTWTRPKNRGRHKHKSFDFLTQAHAALSNSGSKCFLQACVRGSGLCPRVFRALLCQTNSAQVRVRLYPFISKTFPLQALQVFCRCFVAVRLRPSLHQ